MIQNMPKIAEGQSNVRDTYTKKVLRFLYLVQKPVKIDDIVEDTGLTRGQVARVVKFLGKLNKITRKYELGIAKYRSPPRRIVIVSFSKSQLRSVEKFFRKIKQQKMDETQVNEKTVKSVLGG